MNDTAKQCLALTAARAGFSKAEIDEMLDAPESQKHQHRYFVFPAKDAKQYGLQRQNLGRALAELYRAGFIRIVYNGASSHKVNIWEFWHPWKYPREKWEAEWIAEIERWERYNKERTKRKSGKL